MTDVMIDMRHDALRVALLDRRKNGFVRAVNFVRIVVQPADQPDDHAQFRRQIVEQAQQASVAGDLTDQAVKSVILFDLPSRIIEIGGLVKNIDLSP
jgi:hypothetical protein